MEVGDEGDAEWLVTRALPGLSAVDPRWLREPATAVRAVGAGLRALHDALPVADCPFDWSVPARIANAAARGILAPDALQTPPPIDLLVVNLYPFEATVAKGAGYDDCVENIDIGGPAMIRAAAKNHADVAVVVEPDDYTAVLAELSQHGGSTTLLLRKKLAAKAYARTASYDAAISSWFAQTLGDPAPSFRAFGGKLAEALRYGENPHQSAAFYRSPDQRAGVATARQAQGKQLSYNNINDTDAAFELVAEFTEGPAVAIIKHANPCGVARAESLEAAYRRAFDCDRTSAFGGIIALNGTLDEPTARAITEIFTEVVIAPDATEAARAVFAAKKNLRLLITDSLAIFKGSGVEEKAIEFAKYITSPDIQAEYELQGGAGLTPPFAAAGPVPARSALLAITPARD